MPLRIGFDMDGVLADFSLAFHEIEERLFGPGSSAIAGELEKEEEAQEEAGDEGGLPPSPEASAGQGKPRPTTEDEQDSEPTPRQARRRRNTIWRAIESTPNYWETLKPIEEGAVAIARQADPRRPRS